MNHFFSGLGDAANLSAVLLGILTIAAIWRIRDFQPQLRKYYSLLFCIMIMKTVMRLAESLPEQGFGSWMPEIVSRFDFMLNNLFMITVGAYILYLTGTPVRKSRFLRVVCVGYLAQMIFLVALVANYGPLRDYSLKKGGGFLLAGTVLTGVAVPVMTAVLLIRNRRKIGRRKVILLFVSLFVSFFAEVLVFELLLMYDLLEEYNAQKEENARQKISIAVLQMRPHFIYNTMMSIYYLCEQDVKKAQRVTMDFIRYLQRNFSAVAKEGAIPFSEELEHTRAYLAVEQARYEQRLSVVFRTPATAFWLPPLTLQPIVENAVKHGLDPEYGTLTIIVSTREEKDGFAVTVEDTGPGYYDQDPDRPQLALDNIRERLTAMGGRIVFETSRTGGTAVTIHVPGTRSRDSANTSH